MTAYLHALPPKLKIRVADGSNFSGVQFIVTGDYRPIAVIDRQLKQWRLNMSAGKTLTLGLVVSAGSYPSWVSTFALMSMC